VQVKGDRELGSPRFKSKVGVWVRLKYTVSWPNWFSQMFARHSNI